MPANLTPQYIEAERRFRQAKTTQEKIEALEVMLAVIPRHKGTDRLWGDLRRKMAKLIQEAQRRHEVSRKGSEYYVEREGVGQVVLVGLPNAGKSQLIATATGATPEVADYPFTTQAPLPAMMKFENIQIQLLDMPAVSGRGIPSRFANIFRNSDGLLVVVDLGNDPVAQVEAIFEELEKLKIRPVRRGEDNELESGVREKRTVIVGTKSDLEMAGQNWGKLSLRYGSDFPVVAISGKEGTGLEELGRAFYEMLDIIRVYTKAPGKKPDFAEPVVLEKGSTVADAAECIHKDFRQKLKYAQVWGSGKYEGQRVRRDYVLHDGDVIELHI